MFRFSANKISFAASALLLCAGWAQAQTSEQASPLTPSPSTVAVSYQLPATPGSLVTVTVTAAASSDAFVITPSTVPFWLTLGGSGLTGLGGTATTSGVSVTFVANNYAATLGAGTYTDNVHFAVSGYQDLVVPVTLNVLPTASSLTVQTVTGGSVLALTSGNTYTGSQIADLNWTYGSSPYPSIPLTILSSDTPVAFSATVTSPSPASPSWVNLSSATGIAYNFGTGLTVTFLPDVLKNAAVNDTLSFTLNIIYGSTPTTLTYTFTIKVTQPLPTLASAGALFPAYTSPITSGTLKVVVTGTGFYATATNISPTLVYLTYGTVTTPTLITATSIGGLVQVVNPTTMVLTIPYTDAETNTVSILGVAQPVTIYVGSALTGEPSPLPSAVLTVTSNPFITSVVDGGAMQEPAQGATPTFAPYELISIFGDNFCPVSCPAGGVLAQLGTGSRYPDTLSAGGSALTVAFNNQTGTLLANAYLIFANNTQINALVPSTAVPSTTLTGLQIVVTSGSNVSNTYLATPVAANPGIFTTADSGQGQGAILNQD